MSAQAFLLPDEIEFEVTLESGQRQTVTLSAGSRISDCDCPACTRIRFMVYERHDPDELTFVTYDNSDLCTPADALMQVMPREADPTLAAETYRSLQAKELLLRFEEANGRPATTTAELEAWVTTADLESPIRPRLSLYEEA